ncbi:type VI secretion system tip protein VgrG, partial [Neptunomonas phycophila]|nr:type VI secretion system tip protein VgrG [Neptunomonas phycophila]
RSFSAGHTFVLERHDDAPEELGEYVLLSVSHKAQDYSYTSNDEQDKEYSNEFRCISSETIYRPPQTTGWPRMQGPQNAIVVGPEGEEIYTDEYGRVKVQFPWDR